MTGVCPQCTSEYRVAGSRGSRVADYQCPRCKVPLGGKTAGAPRNRYRCPLEEQVYTLARPGADVMSAVPLDRPHRVEYLDPGADRLPFKDENGCYARLAAMHGTVLAAGTVVAKARLHHDPSPWWPCRLVPLTVEEAGHPSTWRTNTPIKYVQCKGCAARLEATAPRPQAAWTPVRSSYIGSGRRHREVIPVKPGPHPAASPACRNCLPETWQQSESAAAGTPSA